MGIIGDAINDIFDRIQDVASFVIIYTLIAFVLGVYYGAYYTGKSAYDYPLWLLFIAILLYVLKEAIKPKKSS